MSERGDLPVGPDGFLDMDRFDATDPERALEPHAYEQLHDAMVNAQTPVPSSGLFDSWVRIALDQHHPGPDTSGLVPDEAVGQEPHGHAPAHEEPGWPDVHDPGVPWEDPSGEPHPPGDHPHDGGAHGSDHL